MVNPPHPGESVRECMEEVGWTVKECADQLGMTPNTLSRLLNGRIGISTRVALGLEVLGWSNADFRMRLQSQYDRAQERRDATVGVLSAQSETSDRESRLV